MLVLHHDGALAAEPAHIEIDQRNAIDRYLAALGLVKPKDQVGEGTFTGARLAD